MSNTLLKNRDPTRCVWMTGYQSFVISALYANLCNLSAWKQFILVSRLNCPFYNPVYIGNLFNRPLFHCWWILPLPKFKFSLAKCHLNSGGYIELRKKMNYQIPSIKSWLSVTGNWHSHKTLCPDGRHLYLFLQHGQVKHTPSSSRTQRVGASLGYGSSGLLKYFGSEYDRGN